MSIFHVSQYPLAPHSMPRWSKCTPSHSLTSYSTAMPLSPLPLRARIGRYWCASRRVVEAEAIGGLVVGAYNWNAVNVGVARRLVVSIRGEAVMAIKRPAKGKGTASHKPASAAPLRHVDVWRPQQMVFGAIYVGWVCKNRSCGLVIATADTAPDDKPTAFDDQLTAIKCPHCGDEDLYRWSSRSEQKYTPKRVSS